MYKEIVRVDKSLRPYQQSAKEQIFSAWEDYDNIMFQMPTGTGKTRLFTSIISDIKAWGILTQKDPKILIVAHRVELIEQISENLDRYKVSHGIIAGGKVRNLRPLVQVESIQTITHRTNRDVANSLGVDFIIIDEAHHSTANSYKKLWELYPNAKKQLYINNIPYDLNYAKQITQDDYDKFDLILYFDEENIYNLNRMFKDTSKVRKLTINNIDDPWYTRDFDKCFNEIYEACLSLKEEILN